MIEDRIRENQRFHDSGYAEVQREAAQVALAETIQLMSLKKRVEQVVHSEFSNCELCMNVEDLELVSKLVDVYECMLERIVFEKGGCHAPSQIKKEFRVYKESLQAAMRQLLID